MFPFIITLPTKAAALYNSKPTVDDIISLLIHMFCTITITVTIKVANGRCRRSKIFLKAEYFCLHSLPLSEGAEE